MQTIEEYKAYTKQLEGEVGKWHHAYDALVVERNALVCKILQHEKTVEISNSKDGLKFVAILKENFYSMAAELEELRKHEVEWDLSKARIKELESAIKLHEGESAKMATKIAELETELELNTETKKGSRK